jgi:hypothetical protein
MDTGKRESGKRPESYGGIAGRVKPLEKTDEQKG